MGHIGIFLYRIYRSLSVDSTVCFLLLSGMLYTLFGPRRKSLPLWQYLVLCGVSFTVLFQGVLLCCLHGQGLIFSHPSHYLYYFLCHVGLSLLWSGLYLQGRLFSRLLCTLFFVASMQMYRGACFPFFGLEGQLSEGLYALLDILLALGLYGFLIGLAAIFHHFGIQEVQVLDRPIRFAMLAILLSLLSVAMLPAYFPTAPVSVGVGCILLTMPVVCFVFARLIRAYEIQRHYDAALARVEAERSAYERDSALRDRIRQERHELKNRYFRLRLLLHEGQIDALQRELETITGVLEELSDIDTGNTYLDYLLSRKERQARDAGIPLHIQIQCPTPLPVDEMAVGTVLANLLDNALEASTQETQPAITISLRCVQGYLHGQVANRVSRDIFQGNPSLHTTKADKATHGYGLSIVRRTLEIENGILRLSTENGQFVASFLLPLQGPAQAS